MVVHTSHPSIQRQVDPGSKASMSYLGVLCPETKTLCVQAADRLLSVVWEALAEVNNNYKASDTSEEARIDVKRLLPSAGQCLG